jgi:hypothetical protein
MIGSYSVDKGDAWEQLDQVNKAGTPVVGIDANNKYHIVKTNNQGNLITGAEFLPGTDNYILTNPVMFTTIAGTPPNNTFLNAAVISNNVETGVYTVNPTFIYQAGGPGGAVTFILYKTDTALGTYLSGLTPLNAFAPSIGDMETGLAGSWDSVPTVLIGGTISHTTRVNNQKTIYCDAGTYGIAVISKTGLNLAASDHLYGVYEFTRVG